MILSSHQPDLLPYTGFWHKMDRADLFDVAIFDQFQSRGYQRRVTMRGVWASLPTAKTAIDTPIDQVRLAPDAADALIRTVQGRYRGARYWKERGQMVIGWIDEARAEHLWQFNLELIVRVRDWLGIETPLAIGTRLHANGREGLMEMCQNYLPREGGVSDLTYLSGTGAQVYLGEVDGVSAERYFRSAEIELAWSTHTPVSGDSILTAIFDEHDPLQIVRMR